MTNRYGFINDIGKDPNAYIFGSGQIDAPVLREDGQWDAYIPPEEFQDLYGVEPYACASFGTLNAIEMILLRKYAQQVNFSDRYLAEETGTQYSNGNSPHLVAEYLRVAGTVNQADWDFTPDIDTFDKFYADPPALVVAEARFFPVEYDFKHDYVPTKPDTLKDALRYSPLGFSVTAWFEDGNGLYFNPGVPNNHWCLCYGYEDDKYWKIFDSYDFSHKKVRWDALPEMAKRYSITRKPVSQKTALELIVDKWRLVLLLCQLQLKRMGRKLGFRI